MADNNIKDKLYGMLAGVALGDALGAPWERGMLAKIIKKNPAAYTGKIDRAFENYNRFKHEVKRSVLGQVTDDTEMTMALGYTIINSYSGSNSKVGQYDTDNAIREYIDFAEDCHCLGTNTRSLFHGIKSVNAYKSRAAKIKEWSQSNGSLMRMSPLAIYADPTNAIEDCKLSNNNPVNIEASTLMHSILRNAIGGNLMAININEEEILTMIRAEKHGFVKIPLYMYSKTVENCKSFREAINWTIRQGGDTDTNAAIVGAAWGAFEGFKKMMKDPINIYNWDIVGYARPGMGQLPQKEKYRPYYMNTMVDELVKYYE